MTNNPTTILDTIWNTPLVKLQHLSPTPHVEIRAKMESHNPWWSVKDRPAYNMIKQAMSRGELKVWDTIIEATSGNTGIALAMVWWVLWINVILVMKENSTLERIATMRWYGATLILTPAEKWIIYARDHAAQLAKQHWYLLLDQFNNQDNQKAHYLSTWPELREQTAWKITHFVSAKWTTGTITGTGTYLKEKNPDIHIVWAEPWPWATIPGIRKRPEAYIPGIYNPDVVDQLMDVTQEDAEDTALLLGKKEWIFCGKSAWGACRTALQVAKQLESWLIVFIVCDTWSRYIASGLFDG